MLKSARLSPADVDAAHAAAQCVVETHKRLSDYLEEGRTLPQIDLFVARTLEELGCRSCFLGYRVPRSPAFPSHACLSVNDCIVHGTAGYYAKPLVAGDVLKVDVGVTRQGWIGDAAWTYVFGRPTPEVQRLCEAGKESLRRGIGTLRPGYTYLDWARAVQGCVEGEYGFHLVRGLGGHGIGRKLHGPPFVSNVVPTSDVFLLRQEWPDAFSRCEPGTILAVEPMLAIGTGATIQNRHEWPIFTADGSIAAHYEHDVLITEEGPRVLTEGLDQVRDVID